MRSILVATLFLGPPTLGFAQARDAVPAPRPRSFSVTGGFGNAMGWLGLQGEKYVSGDRISLFGGLGYTVRIDQGDASGVAVAAGARGYTAGTKHRGFLELSVSQLFVGKFCFNTCRRFYGPGVQAGYQFTTRGGFTLGTSFGVGYAPGVPQGEDKASVMLGMGIGYTWRH